MKNDETPLQMFYRLEKARPDDTWVHQPENKQWTSYSWGQAGDMVRRIAAGLSALELPKGSKVAILSKNSIYWYLCDLAIMMSGHVSVPALQQWMPRAPVTFWIIAKQKLCSLGPLTIGKMSPMLSPLT